MEETNNHPMLSQLSMFYKQSILARHWMQKKFFFFAIQFLKMNAHEHAMARIDTQIAAHTYSIGAR